MSGESGDGPSPAPWMSAAVAFAVGHTWDGQPLPAPAATVTLRPDPEDPGRRGLLLEVEAPYRGDPAPSAPPGALWGLWEYEVVELFLLGAQERYLEVELGPHGHHLVLVLDGVRNPVQRELPLDYTATREGDRWRGRARLPRALLPDTRGAPLRANAYAAWGVGPERRYGAWAPVPGPRPDFHRLGCFRSLPAEGQGA